MTTIVTDNCKGCRFTDCVTVCPVACFHYDDEMLYIDPDVCIDCSACIPECPVQAIFEGDGFKFFAESSSDRGKESKLPFMSQDSSPGFKV